MTTGDRPRVTADDVVAWCAAHLVDEPVELDDEQLALLRALYPATAARRCTPTRPRSRLLITRAR